MAPSRRAVLAAAGSLALAGCGAPGTPGRSTDPSPAGPPGGDRPTATARDPEPLAAGGAWPQRGGGPGHAGVTDAGGVPGEGRAYWHLRRVRSGPPVLAGGRLFHYARLGEDAGGRATLTRTREPDAGTAHPVYGVPYLLARDAGEGRIEWAARLPGRGAGWPAAAGGTVVAAVSGRVAAFDADDGVEQWSVALEDRPAGDPTVAGDTVLVPLQGAVDGASGDAVYGPEVRAFALDDGRARWTVGAPARAVGVAAAREAVVVLAHGFDGDGTVRARSLADGRERWRVDLRGAFRFEGPVVAGGRVYVAGSDDLRALALADGSEDWRVGDGGDGVAADGDAVYAVGDERLVTRDASDGSVRWSFAADGGSLAAPAVGGGVVYVGGEYADLYALDARDGTERWSVGFPSTVVEGDVVTSGPETQPTVAEGAVYVYAADGLYAFGPA